MASRLSFNEGKPCDAVVRRIEARECGLRRNLRFPERERHPAPVELVCEIGARLFAFEHTGIEPFTGHMQIEAEAVTHCKPIEVMVAGKLPPSEHFQLHVQFQALSPARVIVQRPSLGFQRDQRGDIEAAIVGALPRSAPVPRCIASFIVPSVTLLHIDASPGHFDEALARASAAFRHPLGALAEVGKRAIGAAPALAIAADFMTGLAQRAWGA